jgi:hypothetical protein
MKHTPGPWVVHFSRAQVDAFDGEDGQPLPVCKLLWPTTERSEAETYVNAKLIAASPDLLAACKRALAVFRAQGESTRRGNVLAALEDAISKAEDD